MLLQPIASWCTSDGRDRESHAGQDHRGGKAEQQDAVPAGEAQRPRTPEGSKVQGSLKECGEKMVVTMGYMDQSSPMTSPSDSSWDPILDSPDRRNLEDFLTEQEKIDLRNLVLARKGMTPPDEVILTEESQ